MSKLTFEKAMKELEQVVQELESSDLPLEKAMKKFEEGIQLSKFCSGVLEEMEKKVTILLKDQNGTIRETEFKSQETDHV